MAALLAILAAVVGGQAIGLVLAGLGLPAWLTLADLILNLAVDEVKLLVAIHPAFAHLNEQLRSGKPKHIAAMNARDLAFRLSRPEDYSPHNHLGMGM
jgi:hypothetical protein